MTHIGHTLGDAHTLDTHTLHDTHTLNDALTLGDTHTLDDVYTLDDVTESGSSSRSVRGKTSALVTPCLVSVRTSGSQS